MKNPSEPSTAICAPSTRRRIWYGLIVGGVLIAVLTGLALWLPWHRQTEALAEVKHLGGVFKTEPVGSDWLRDQAGTEFMAGYDRVVKVHLWNTPVKDDDLAAFSSLFDLKTFALSNTRISDAGLVHLGNLLNLKYLDFTETQATGSGLVHLTRLNELGVLSLYDTQVTNDALQHLTPLTKLHSLGLGKTKVTDAGLVNLSGLTTLRYLDLNDTHVTDAGLRAGPSISVRFVVQSRNSTSAACRLESLFFV
jgi:Leucine-rich repeat (LRR) protein